MFRLVMNVIADYTEDMETFLTAVNKGIKVMADVSKDDGTSVEFSELKMLDLEKEDDLLLTQTIAFTVDLGDENEDDEIWHVGVRLTDDGTTYSM